MGNVREQYAAASVLTGSNLKTVAHSLALQELSSLTLPEIEAAADLIAQVVPAGNIPGMILNGLARLPGRRPPAEVVRRDMQLLFDGVERTLDKVVYGAMFAGPAAVIWGYQNLLKLAGKRPEDAFPDGTWQFYVAYALREDSARHANETAGFDRILRQHQIQLSAVDRLTAWTMAAIYCLHQYGELLHNEWRERVYTALLRQVTPGTAVYQAWEKQRPYGRTADAGRQSYPAFRRERFDRFLAEHLAALSPDQRGAWQEGVKQAEESEWPAYERQMTILAYLEAGPYGETGQPLPLDQAHVGLIHHGRYYLLPVCMPGSQQPLPVLTVRGQIAAIVDRPAGAAAGLTALAQVKRPALAGLRGKLSQAVRADLDMLRLAPILLNAGQRPRALPLAEVRQAERGVGDHALTIFDTGETFVFDQSHIFFDGAWGAALAEILTNEALSWAVYLNSRPPAEAGRPLFRAPAFAFTPADRQAIAGSPRISPEAAAETEAIEVKPMLALRKLFKQRSDLLQLTVNDLLVLYRAIHAATYRPKPALLAELQRLAATAGGREGVAAALQAIEESATTNPAILIPIDASQRSPKERLYPVSLEAPLAELDLLKLHRQTLAALDGYEQATGDRAAAYAHFDSLQRTYLAALAGFGQVMGRIKEVALLGESASVGTMKLLAHLPVPLQRLLDQIPGRFDVLNDLIKGREVFSNVGVVAPGSSLTRFITAKDDNDKKTLAWGVMTDARGVMRLSLRDFRPHVGLLAAAGRSDLARWVAQDYVDSYAAGMNKFVRELRRVTVASRETRLKHPLP
jgi:hypothetical protein